jgi:hypothetical protein
MSENLSSKIQGSNKTGHINKSGLPSNYGDTKAVMLPRDPIWIYVYWEINQSTIESIKNKYGQNFDHSALTIRIYDVTDINFDGTNANKSFDISVNPNAASWYVNVGEFNRSWCVDMGYILKNGEFITVARTNSMAMPRHGVSNVTDEQWALLQLEFEKLLRISGGGHIGQSSYDLVKLMRERWEELTKLPTSGVLGGASSSFKRDESHSSKAGISKEKSFWLKADTEIIVYGATEPDATLMVQGKSVPLGADGSFSLRFYLPDGQQSYPIEAISSDGTMRKHIAFNVQKETK